MSMSPEEYAKEEVLQELHAEAVWKKATLAQCIYIFVEGQSEEEAFPILLERAGLDLEESGFVIANYNGFGNLQHVLRLMNITLSHDRPIVITYDNDVDVNRIITKPAIAQIIKNSNFISSFCIPYHPVVTYSNSHRGGSFEESFPSELFIDLCFSKEFMNDKLIEKKKNL